MRIRPLSTVESWNCFVWLSFQKFLVVDKLIHGCMNPECKRKLMAKGKNVTVKQCLDILRQHEAIDVTMKHLGEASQINASYSRDPSKQSRKNGSKISTRKPSTKLSVSNTPVSTAERRCQWCNREQHSRDCCPAKASVCNFCTRRAILRKLAD